MNDDLLKIQAVIRTAHACDCRHHSTTLANERVGKLSWAGRVEIWTLIDHVTARYCYGWREADGSITTVLQIPPVISPQTAVRAVLSERAKPQGSSPENSPLGDL